jgi:glyoxylase-like metal-dependent hydrolase (beta-lactamase superfamily II)
MNAPAAITITPVFVADLLAEGERMPVYVHVIDHPDARVLVDTGMTDLHAAGADLDPRLRPLSTQDFDLAGIDIVINTHLHFDHCGGNLSDTGRRRTVNQPHAQLAGTVGNAHERRRRSRWSPGMELQQAVLATGWLPSFTEEVQPHRVH